MPKVTKYDIVRNERYLRISPEGEFAIDSEEPISAVDFHTHLGDALNLPVRVDVEARTGPMIFYAPHSLKNIDLDAIGYYHFPRFPSLDFFRDAADWFLLPKWLKRANIPNLLNSMEQNGVERSVILPIDYNNGDEPSLKVIDICRRYPGLIPFCSVHPRDPQKAEKLRRYASLGARGVKLHPPFQRVRPDSPPSMEICEEVEGLGIPVIFHTGNRVRVGKESSASLRHFPKVISEFPEVKFVLAHIGADQHDLAIELAGRHDNVWVEVSGQTTEVILKALKALGSEKILYGSDWAWYNVPFSLSRVLLATEGDPVARRRILQENAESLLGI
ncbi:MAG: amidohydrolase family protein [bacterium]